MQWLLMYVQPLVASLLFFGCSFLIHVKVHEMTTLHRTYEASNELAIFKRIFDGRRSLIDTAHFTPALQSCINDMLSHEGADRSSAAELLKLKPITARVVRNTNTF